MTAILHNIDDANRVNPNNLGTGWHLSNTNLALKGPFGGHVFEPLTAIAYVRPADKLQRAKTYCIVGPFGHNHNSGESAIKHSHNSKTDVVINPQDLGDLLAGKAVVNGVGKIVDFYFEDVDKITGWELTVNAKHNWFDPRTEEIKEFIMTYQFGLFTPMSFYWPQIAVGARMLLHGYVIRKDIVSGRFIVKLYLAITSVHPQFNYIISTNQCIYGIYGIEEGYNAKQGGHWEPLTGVDRCGDM
ncbi:uncharacterized protein MELLADRAFT_113931 [Melampsora larici-populina 98AG31]|uniref:Uncharacterized protein n=1 Tax=Melampsora larici-populina (strain 98AG31 / pathotype 3-4-7) TaxID=747676 RepID=F4RG31_MELLP|nr:uncharacterized protein MELLADRAFT_104970 [Melampsora larici-populina 98AG31]XP_007418764.1 uncharacterized protein MELLADRAFT_113931 [Melampsora larici-populina 98AG31]EGF97983.1 hypothetical protein MELLADRAFT_113931 [Melampsora larici-populina 98AG31]EGG08613.1 hypothetical protein MELLADRAFT_104970 [Melampsora larici-populina 98AG31]